MFDQNSQRSSLGSNYAYPDDMYTHDDPLHAARRSSGHTQSSQDAFQQAEFQPQFDAGAYGKPARGPPANPPVGMPAGPYVDQMYPMAHPPMGHAQYPAPNPTFEPYIKNEYDELPMPDPQNGYAAMAMGPSFSGNGLVHAENYPQYAMPYPPPNLNFHYDNFSNPMGEVQKNYQSQQKDFQKDYPKNYQSDSPSSAQNAYLAPAVSAPDQVPRSSRALKTEPDPESPKSDTTPDVGEKKGKSAHNVIEQRYRNKINYKFTMLQDSVPTLRAVAHKKRPEDDSDDDVEEAVVEAAGEENLEGLEPARKLNKGTILTKSLEYIKFLESKHEQMLLEHRQLAERLRALGYNVEEA